MIDPFYGSLVQGGLGLVGSLFGGGRKDNLTRDMQLGQIGMLNYALQNQAYADQFKGADRDYEEWRRAAERRTWEGAIAQQDQLFEERNKQIQLRVADAKAAGLHPLFALGASVNGFSPTFAGVSGGSAYGESGGSGFSGDGQYDSGSPVGDVASALSDVVGGYFSSRQAREEAEREASAAAKAAKLAERATEARVKRDEAEASYYASLAQRASQKVNQTRPAYDEQGVMVFPAPDAPKLSWQNLPTKVMPKVKTASESHAIGKYGEQALPYMPQELGGDEVNQIIWLMNQSIDNLRRLSNVFYTGKEKGR